MRLIPKVIGGLVGLLVVSAVAVHAEEPREGTCDLAEELFPDTQPGSRVAEGDCGSRADEPRDLRPEPRCRHCAGEGALLGHAGGQRRRAGLRVVPLPRRRRSAFRQPGEPRRPGQSRPDDRSGRSQPSTEGVGLPAAQAGRSHRPDLDGAAKPRRRRLVPGRAPAAIRACGTGRDPRRDRSWCPTRYSTSAASTRVARSRATRRR